MSIRSTLRDELREIAWLASIVSALSVLGMGLAVTLALALRELKQLEQRLQECSRNLPY
jgi:hypothetical protein